MKSHSWYKNTLKGFRTAEWLGHRVTGGIACQSSEDKDRQCVHAGRAGSRIIWYQRGGWLWECGAVWELLGYEWQVNPCSAGVCAVLSIPRSTPGCVGCEEQGQQVVCTASE